MTIDYLDIFDTFRIEHPNVFDWEDLNNAIKWSINGDGEYLKFIFGEIKEPILTNNNYIQKTIVWTHQQEPIDIDNDPDELNKGINEIINNDNFNTLINYWNKYKL